MKKIYAYLLITLFFVSACTAQSVKHYAPDITDEIRKQFSLPASDKANIYIFRDEYWGHGLNTEVFLNGKILGKNMGWTYLFVTVDAGQHKITSHFNNFVSLDVTCESGKNYFIRETIDVWSGHGASLQLVGEEDGKKGVLECKLVDTVKY